MEGKFIIIIAVALFFIALVQLMKIYDLAAKVRGAKSQEKMTRGENMLMANLMLVFMVVFFGFIGMKQIQIDDSQTGNRRAVLRHLQGKATRKR